jgi:hypothetical protein
MIPDHELGLLEQVPHIESMLELGNKRAGDFVYKGYFEGRGIRHVSVDLNGKDGSLALDLQEPLYLGQFDVVTNFGTSEHVELQEPVWRNIHEAGRWHIHVIPHHGDWPGHGKWYVTKESIAYLAGLNGYKIHLLDRYNREVTYMGRKRLDQLVRAVFEKVRDRPFVWDEFAVIEQGIPGKVGDYTKPKYAITRAPELRRFNDGS